MEHLQIDPPLLDDLLSALRRHDRADCERLLAGWEAEERVEAHPDPYEWDVDDEVYRYLDHPLTAWTHREVALLVAAGLFEYALCLVERYRRPITAADLASAIHNGHHRRSHETRRRSQRLAARLEARRRRRPARQHHPDPRRIA
jgi:hypothetical protein